MKLPGRKPQALLVDKELYDSMVSAFQRVKTERFKNKQEADKIDHQLHYLKFEIDALEARIGELVVNANSLQGDVQGIADNNLRTKLGGKSETVVYVVLELEDKIDKISKSIDDIRKGLKVFRDYVGAG